MLGGLAKALRGAVFATAFMASGALSAAESRIGLVIGNGAYADAPLRNPVNDARSMAQTLRDLNFDVVALENADRLAMQRALLDFGRRLKGGPDAALFYFAGHGMQVRGANYLIPVKASIQSEEEVEVEGVDVNYVMGRMAMAKSRFNIVILDACRNNPFERSFRSATRGLAAISAPTGTLIAYATAPGSVAADGNSANGLYTGELIEALRLPGLKMEEAFKRTRGRVMARSGGRQTPWESSSVVGDFVFKPKAAAVEPLASVDIGARNEAMRKALRREAELHETIRREKILRETAEREAAANAATQRLASRQEADIAMWNAVKDSEDAGDFRKYLDAYPGGAFSRLAESRIASLTAPTSLAPSSPTTRGEGDKDQFEALVKNNWRAVETAIKKHAVENERTYWTILPSSAAPTGFRINKAILQQIQPGSRGQEGRVKVWIEAERYLSSGGASPGWDGYQGAMTYRLRFNNENPVIGEFAYAGRQ